MYDCMCVFVREIVRHRRYYAYDCCDVCECGVMCTTVCAIGTERDVSMRVCYGCACDICMCVFERGSAS